MTTPTTTTTNTHRLIAFTTPGNYAARLSALIHRKGWTPLWCPTISVAPTTHTKSNLLHYISPPHPQLHHFSAIAFTSRTGVTAFSDALSALKSPPLPPSGDHFQIWALGKDSELITKSFVDKICTNSERIKILVPEIASPAGVVAAIGWGSGLRVLCPVPVVVGLEEPPVVNDFIRGLGAKGWVGVRVGAYETRWLGAECAAALWRREGGGGGGGVDAVVFTSTAEVEGVLKGLRAVGVGWEAVVERSPAVVVAAHGPVTAAGAEGLGVKVDVVSREFGSFEGVVEALDRFWNS